MIADTSRRRTALFEHEARERSNERFEDIRRRSESLNTGLELSLTGFEDPHTRDLILASKYLRKARMPTLKPMLPLMLRLKGKPYTLNDYFPFEPFFRTRMPKRVLLKTGRQVSKTTSLAAQGIIISNSIPYFSTLYVTPLFEMVRRFSHQYVRQFLEESPVKRLFMGSKTLNNVLQRSFLNGSNMFFSYAFLDAERTRGIPADKNCIVEGGLITMADGSRLPIERVPIGSPVLSADKDGMLTVDTVTDRIDQGMQHAYEVTFSNGATVNCTIDERFRRTDGTWVYLSDLLGRPSQAQRSAPELVPGADAIGLFARRRDHQQVQPDSVLASRVPSRRPSGGLLPAQGRAVDGLRAHTAHASAERRLGRYERRVCNGLEPDVRHGRRHDDGERCEITTIVRVRYLGRRHVWDLNTTPGHAYFVDDVLVHNSIDEIQDINFEFLEIIHQTLSGSPYQLYQYAGTPKSLDNTMETLWQDTSQAEWAIKCHHPGCGEYNIPCLSHDLLEMIGPHSREIGPDRAGVICVVCGKPLDPRRFGRWVHAIPERRFSFPGYHVPQIIMPMHYANHERWNELLGRFQGRGNTTRTAFLNESCGESCDVGSKLVTISDLKTAACLPWKNRAAEAVKHIKTYRHRVLAVDWGGGGGRIGNSADSKKDSEKRLRTSFTTLAALGIRGDGKVDVLWGHRSLRTHDYLYEAQLCVEAMAKFRCTHMVHDYNGSGAVREVFVRQSGVPENRIIPIAYHPTGRHNLMVPHPATDDHPREWYSVDKARSLAVVCECIKQGLLRFFEFDRLSSDNLGLISDFLALQEEKTSSRVASDVFVITKNPNMSDDFAQAVNIGCCALWYMTESWPDLAAAAKFTLSPELLKMLHPQEKVEWNDI